MDRFEALEALFDEVRLGMHRIVQVTEALHADEPITLGMRAVLEFLTRRGEATVPAIARSRHVSRQHIQALVHPLLQEGLVETRDNPAHRRSPLLAITPAGRRTMRRLRDRERRAFGALGGEATRAEIEAATRTLRCVRLSLANP